MPLASPATDPTTEPLCTMCDPSCVNTCADNARFLLCVDHFPAYGSSRPIHNQRQFVPRVTIDHEGLAFLYSKSAIPILEFLTGAISRPSFSLSRVCSPCADWDAGHRSRLERKPNVPGAEDPTYSCHGCLFSLLDSPSHTTDDDGFAEFILQQISENIEYLKEQNEDAITEAISMRKLDRSSISGLKSVSIRSLCPRPSDIPGPHHRQIREAEERINNLYKADKLHHVVTLKI